MKRRKILGLTEKIKLKLPNRKNLTIKAKIDTGAHYTSLDISLTKKLGLEKTFKQFTKLCPKFKITQRNFKRIKKKINQEIKPRLLKKLPQLKDIRVVPAVNGFSIRPYVEIEFSLKGKKIKTKASLAKRKHMKYLVLIGKEDLKGFLINSTKHVYEKL